MAEEAPGAVTVRLSWDQVENVPILLVNQIIGQIGQQDEVLLTFGQVAPPILAGDPDQQREQAREIPFVPITPVARLALTRAGLDEMIRILNETRDNYDKVLGAQSNPPEEGSEK